MSIKRDEGLTVWQVERHVQKGAGVTWSYGALSTMDLVLSYGFVPQVCVPMCPYMCPVCALSVPFLSYGFVPQVWHCL